MCGGCWFPCTRVEALVTSGGTRWHGVVTLRVPSPSWWLRHVEEASIRGVPLTPHSSVSISRVRVGGERGALVGGGLAWPSPGTLSHTIDGPLLSALGIVDVISLIGGALTLWRWAADLALRTSRSRRDRQKQANHAADTAQRPGSTQHCLPAKAAQ